MSMRFNPGNPIIKLCMVGMMLEGSGELDGALAQFEKAWNEATDDYEKFMAAYHLARLQKNIPEKCRWYEISLQCARNINDENVISAYPTLYTKIAECHGEMSELEEADRNFAMAETYRGTPTDKGPFFHGTKADLPVGDLLTAGGLSNYQDALKMNHIYFTANANGAGLAAALAKGDGPERVYIVEPTGDFENDPNVTDKKFPGNLTRSYRSQEPLRIVGELTDWAKLTQTETRVWKEKLEKNKGEIIN